MWSGTGMQMPNGVLPGIWEWISGHPQRERKMLLRLFLSPSSSSFDGQVHRANHHQLRFMERGQVLATRLLFRIPHIRGPRTRQEICRWAKVNGHRDMFGPTIYRYTARLVRFTVWWALIQLFDFSREKRCELWIQVDGKCELTLKRSRSSRTT